MNKNKTTVFIAGGLVITLVTGMVGNFILRKNNQNQYNGEEITTSIVMTTDASKQIQDEITILETTNIKEETSKKQETIKRVETTKEVVKSEEKEDFSFLRKELSDILQKKNFDNKINEFIYNNFDKLCKNYQDFSNAFKICNMPSMDQYMASFFNNIKNNIDEIKIIDVNDPKNQKEKDYLDTNGGCIGIFITKDNAIYLDSRNSDDTLSATLFHEMVHSGQKKISLSNGNISTGMHKILKEGESTFFEGLINGRIINDSAYYINNGNDMYRIQSSAVTSNAIFSKYYCMLMNLTDYNTMQKCKENFDINMIVNSIETNYDIDAKKMLNCMQKSAENCFYGDESIALSDICLIENMYCDCMSQKINSIDSKEEAIQVLDNYRYYKMQYSINCVRWDNDYNAMNITYDKFNKYSKIESSLLNKLNDFSVLPEGIEKEIFDVLVNVDNPVKCKENSINGINYYNEGNSIYIVENSNKSATKYDVSDKNTVSVNYSDVCDKCSPLINNYQKKM